MSMVAVAARLCLWQALQNTTFAQDRVFDSSLSPIDVKSDTEKLPVIIISTDDEVARVTGMNLLGADRELDIIVEMSVATALKVDDGFEIEIPPTDEGLELIMNFMHRQIYRAILSVNNPYSEFFKGFITKIKTVTARRGGEAEKGTRYAARQLIFKCETLHEPNFGDLRGGIWLDFIAELRKNENLRDLASQIQAQIIGEDNLDWQITALQIGASRKTLQHLGLAPLNMDANISLLNQAIVTQTGTPNISFGVP
jgi:hypothetical protein